MDKMKMKKLLTVILLVCMALTLAFALSSCSDENAETEMISVTVKKDKENVQLKATLDSVYVQNHKGEKLYVLALPTSDTSYIPANVDVVGEVKVKADVKLNFSLYDEDGFSRLSKAFVIAEKTDYSYAPITGAMYVHNPEILAEKQSIAPEVSDIKGINTSDVYDAHLAGASRTLFTVDMSVFMLDEYKDGAIKYNKDGVSYFFSGAYVEALDEKIKSANDLGMRVYLRTVGYVSVLNSLVSGSQIVIDPEKAIPDVSDEDTARRVEAFYCFLADRYSGEYGQVSDYIIGQNGNRVVLDSEEEQERVYQAWVRAAHIALRSVDSNAQVYVSVSNKWRNSGSGSIGAKSFLAHFAEQSRLSGDYGWAISLDLGQGADLPALLETDSYDYSNIGVDNMNEVLDLVNTADMRYKSEKREFIIDSLALPLTISESNRATYYICAYYKAAQLGAKAFFYNDSFGHSLLDKNSNRGALYYMFLLCGTNKTEQLTEYTRKVEGFTGEDMQKHVFKKLTFLQNAKYEISESDSKKVTPFPVGLDKFEENGITRAQLSLDSSKNRELDVFAKTALGIGAVTAFDVDAKQIKASKYLGITVSSENAPSIVVSITDENNEIAYVAQTDLVNGESEYYFDITGFGENVSEADKLTVSICIVSDDLDSQITVSDMSLYGNSGLGSTTVIIIVIVAAVALVLVVGIVLLALKRKKKHQQD